MITRREFLKAGAAAFEGEAQEAGERIYVNIPEFVLKFKGTEYEVSVGRPNYMRDKEDRWNPETPIGRGIIKDKLDRVVFSYLKGPKKGQIIKYCHNEEGVTGPMPYKDIRSLHMLINKTIDRCVIHSTTESWNLGRPVSSGCIRMAIPDMLSLYPQVPKGTPILLDYDTIKMDESGFKLLPDIYRKGTNTVEALERKLRETGLEGIPRERLQNALEGCLGEYVPFKDLEI